MASKASIGMRVSATSFVDLEDALFAHDGDAITARAHGFVAHALGRRARVRTKTDRYPTIPMGPDTVGSYLRQAGETTWISVHTRARRKVVWPEYSSAAPRLIRPSVARSSAAT